MEEKGKNKMERIMDKMIDIGTKTKWEIVQAVGYVGERYYWTIDKYGTASMMPATVVEGTDSIGSDKVRGEIE